MRMRCDMGFVERANVSSITAREQEHSAQKKLNIHAKISGRYSLHFTSRIVDGTDS